MTAEWLLSWWNLIYIVPFGLAMVYLGLYSMTGMGGDHDADADADADVDADAHGDAGHDVDADADADADVDADADADAGAAVLRARGGTVAVGASENNPSPRR